MAIWVFRLGLGLLLGFLMENDIQDSIRFLLAPTCEAAGSFVGVLVVSRRHPWAGSWQR